MERQPVKSSFIASVGYDPAAKMLEVQFINGKVYQYFDISPETFAELQSSESIGKALNKLKPTAVHRRATELEEPEETAGQLEL